MFKTSRNYLLLSLILIFSFVYRVVLMLRETFPPGADIGLHNSVIYSITQSGNTNFLWNYFHMGGGSSVTFPGYHIFVSYVILLTGMPDYVAHSLVVSLFSSLIVLCAFLITRKVWNASAALIVAFLVAVSRFDIEMLMWGGYPNVITLMLIPLAFYLFLEKDRFSLYPFLAVTSLVSGAIFLTHSLSAIMFVAITFATVFFASIFARRVEARRTTLLVWLLPLVLGAIIISPFLIHVAPAYLGSNADTFTGGVVGIRQAVLSTKILPLELVLPLFACIILFFLFSKEYIGKFLSVPAFLLALWTVIPALLTQGYLVGLYTDYNRFMYFVILPVILLIGLVIYHSAGFFASTLDWLLSMVREMPQVRIGKHKTLARLMPHLTRKNFLSVIAFVFLLYAFLAVPVFVVPSKGIEVQSFYQVMNPPEYEAMQWAQKNTPANSLFVTDALYGWWFSGFAQRPTISAVEPQYLTNIREFEPAKVALSILDTDYIVDNGLIQIREDGGYIARHNPIFLAKLDNSYFPYPFFHFNNGGITITLRDANGNVQIIDLSKVPVTDQHIENNTDQASIYVTRGNQLFNFTQKTTVYNGFRFVNMTETIESTDPAVTLDTVRFILHTKGISVQGENDSVVGFMDTNMKVMGQLLFTKEQPQNKVITEENPAALEMTYILDGKSNAELKFSVGVYQFKAENLTANSPTKSWLEYGQELLAKNTKPYMNKVPDLQLDVFNYQQALIDQKVSYVAVRDSDSIPRFAKDRLFSLVFINNEVAIFQVRKNLG